MLLPALSKAREKARNISCVNQLKQLYTGAYMYTDSNDDTLPKMSATCATAYSNLNTLGDAWFGLINFYVTNEKTFACPADTNKKGAFDASKADKGGDIDLSYGFNAAFGGTATAEGTWADASPNLTVENPSATLMMADCGADDDVKSGWGVLYASVNTGTGATAESENYLAYRHGDRFNVVFFDGHAEGFAKSVDNVNTIKLSLTGTGY